jgi:hypothetical protein
MQMIRSVASKVMWVGRATVFLVGLAVILALVFGLASAALGANNQSFILGETNVATLITRLAGPDGVDGAMFEVRNNDADDDDTALSLKVQAAEAPMTVNSQTKVTNLNADKLDDQEASDFLPAKTYEFEVQRSIGPSTSVQVSIPCDQGDLAVSGGFNELDDQSKVIRSESRDDTSNVWVVTILNQGTQVDDVVEYEVVCADFPPLRP